MALMDHSSFILNLHLYKKAKSFTAARKSILKLVNCQVWWRNIVKYGKYTFAKFANFVYFCITHGKALPLPVNFGHFDAFSSCS